MLGVPAIAVSQQSQKREMDFRLGREFDFSVAATFIARMVARLPGPPARRRDAPERQLSGRLVEELPAPGSHGWASGSTATSWSCSGRTRRRPAQAVPDLWRRSPYHAGDGTDFAAIDADMISVTPLHFELTDVQRMEELRAGTSSSLIGARPPASS